MKWQPPTFEEIGMSAEIGAYQADDPEERRPAARPETRRDEPPAAAER